MVPSEMLMNLWEKLDADKAKEAFSSGNHPILIARHPTHPLAPRIYQLVLEWTEWLFDWYDPELRAKMLFQVALRCNTMGLRYPTDVPNVNTVDASSLGGDFDRILFGGERVLRREIVARQQIDVGALGLSHYGGLIINGIDTVHEPTIRRAIKAVHEHEVRHEIVVEKGATGRGRRDRTEIMIMPIRVALLGTCGLCPCGGTGIEPHLIGVNDRLHACNCPSDVAEGYPEKMAEELGMRLLKLKD